MSHEPIAEPAREKRRDTLGDFFASVLKFQKRALPNTPPLAGRNGAMEGLTVRAPQTFRDRRSLRAGPRPFEPAREKRAHILQSLMISFEP
jgi:hypothetical protein